MLIAFIVIFFLRKVQDWYVRATIGLLVGALVLRLAIIIVMFT